MGNIISKQQQALLASDSKIGILVTRDEDGYPHLTFISSIQALGESRLTFGKFCEGLSKRFITERPEAGFLALNGDMEFLRGTAVYDSSAQTGKEFDEYNKKPMFRYNSYFGFSRIYYLNVDDITPTEKLSMKKIVVGAVLTRIAALFQKQSVKGALGHVGKGIFAELDSLKFIAYYDGRLRARIIPVIQAGPAGTDRVVFSLLPFGKEIKRIPKGCKAAVFAVNLKMESVLVKGIYEGVHGLPRSGRFVIERVYNSMPPKNEYIYPSHDALETITDF